MHYIRDNDLTPKQFASKLFKIKLLLPYLQQYDRRWCDVPFDQMKTTPPRTLVQYMNTHVARWKKQFETVQKVIDALPESRDHTSEMQAGDKKSLTLSDNHSHDFEEIKHGETPLSDQKSMNMNDYPLITDKKVG